MVEEKRHFEKPIPISDLVQLDRERCILCDRCTRFAKEVAGDPLIHFLDRGNQTQVNTFPDDPFASYFSGNTVQICPVGALTGDAVPLQGPAVGPRAGRVHLHVVLGGLPRRHRLVPRTRCSATRASTSTRSTGAGSATRAASTSRRSATPTASGRPMLRPSSGGELAPSPLVRGARRGRRGAARRARAQRPVRGRRLGGARLTNEAAYAWAKLAKGVIGTDNVDAQLGDGLPAAPCSACPAPRSTTCARPGGTVLLLGPDLKEELPVLYLRLRHAVIEDGVKLVVLSPAPTGLDAARGHVACATAPARPSRRSTRCSATAAPPAGADAQHVARAIDVLRKGEFTVVSGGPRWPTRAPTSAAAASAILRGSSRGPLPAGPAPGQRPRRPRHGPRPGRAARPGQARRRPPTGTRPRGTRCRPSRASTAPASSRPPPTAASTRWSCSAPTRWPTSPTATSPSAASPAPAPSSPRHLPHRLGRRGRRRARRRPATPRSAAPPPTSRAGSACSARRSRRPAPPGPTG